MLILSEYDAMSRIIEGLELARDGARMMGAHQPDKAHQWDKLAAGYEVARELAYKLSEESARKAIKQ
jgi:hypothetical protein